MVGRIAARVLAPIAIIAVGVVVYLIVHSTLIDNRDGVAHGQVHKATATGGHRRRHHHHRAPRFYVVKPGDTLSQIAAKTHHSTTALERLNPSISPNALQTGQRLRLRR